jgi:hypothetical protein
LPSVVFVLLHLPPLSLERALVGLPLLLRAVLLELQQVLLVLLLSQHRG